MENDSNQSKLEDSQDMERSKSSNMINLCPKLSDMAALMVDKNKLYDQTVLIPAVQRNIINDQNGFLCSLLSQIDLKDTDTVTPNNCDENPNKRELAYLGDLMKPKEIFYNKQELQEVRCLSSLKNISDNCSII